MADSGFQATISDASSMQFIMPSGVQEVGSGQGVNDAVSISIGTPAQTGQNVLTGSEKNTRPGPPIFTWNKYDTMWSAYWATGGFYDGTALTKMLTETDDQYTQRRAMAYYRNFFRQIIDATFKPVFAVGSQRTTTVNGVADQNGSLAPVWNKFLENVDNRRHRMSQFVKKVIRNARITEICYIIVDNFPKTPDNRNTAIATRAYPYVYIRLPQQVEEKLTVVDDYSELQEIVFKEAPVKVWNEKSSSYEMEKRWKKWTKDFSVQLKQDKETREMVEVAGTKVQYNLPEIPVIPVASSESEDGTVLPMPSYYSVMKCNWAIYNWDSAQSREIAAKMYPILVLPRPSTSDVSNLQAVNPLQGFYAPPSENGTTPAKAEYLQYPVNDFQALAKYEQDLIDDLFRQCGQLGVSGTSTTNKQQSGISKSFDFHAQHFILKESSMMAKYAEEEIARKFKMYVPENFEYEVHYEEDFEPDKDVDADVQLYTDYISMDPGPEGRKLALKMATYSVFDDAEDDDVDVVIEDIESNTKDQKMLDNSEEQIPLTPEEQTAKDQKDLLDQTVQKYPTKKSIKKIPPKTGYSIGNK